MNAYLCELFIVGPLFLKISPLVGIGKLSPGMPRMLADHPVIQHQMLECLAVRTASEKVQSQGWHARKKPTVNKNSD